MQEIIKECFVRVRAGEWLCRAPVAIRTPGETINPTPGIVYRAGKLTAGFDVARMLEEWLATGHTPPNIDVHRIG